MDHHESAHQNDQLYLYSQKGEGAQKKLLWRFGMGVCPPHFKICASATAYTTKIFSINQTSLQHPLQNKPNIQCFTRDKLKDIFTVYIYGFARTNE